MRPALVIVVLVLCFGPAAPAPAMMMEGPIGEKYCPVSRTPQIDIDLQTLGNSPGRVYGTYWWFSEIGQTDRLYFVGDTAAFGKFLLLYSKLKARPLKLIIHRAPALPEPVSLPDYKDREIKAVKVDQVVYDWEFRRHLPDKPEKPEEVWLEVWGGGNVKTDRLKIPSIVQVEFASDKPKPPNVSVESGGEIGKFIKRVSHGNSRLLTGECASANPTVGFIARSPEWGDQPFISVCPLSAPVKTKIEGIGDCILLGSMSLLVRSEQPGARESPNLGDIPVIQPGVYLLAYNGECSDKEGEWGVVYPVSVTVDKDGNPTFKPGSGVRTDRYTRPTNVDYYGEDWFGASVSFPKKDQVSKANPAWRATVELTLHEPDGRYRSYSLQLDLEITME